MPSVSKENIPQELLTKREAVECNWVFSLWKNPDLIPDYKNVINSEDIITSDGMFYYGLAQGLYKAGFNNFDNMSVYTYLEDKPKLKKIFEQKGGYSTVDEILSLISIDNVDSYYDALCHSNLLIRLNEKGFPVLNELEKFNQMSYSEVYDYYEYILANISIGNIEKTQSFNLSDKAGYAQWLDDVDKGLKVGYRVNTPMLNYMMAGIHPSNLMLHIAGIGRGKTTTAILLYVLGLIKNSENICIVSNEQGVDEFRSMLIPCVIFNELHLKVKGLNRQKFVTGNFTPEQKEAINDALDWLEAQGGKIEFVPLMDYGITNIRKVVKKYSKIGYGCFLIDTIKPLDEADSAAWAEFSEVSKELFLLAKQTETAIICTAQATGESLRRKYLDLSCIAKSKAIAETATQVIGFRDITSDEIDKVHPWVYKKNPSGSSSKIKEVKDLDPNEHYICMFVMKNRFGPTDPQIVMKFNQSMCTIEEIGYYNSPYDGAR